MKHPREAALRRFCELLAGAELSVTASRDPQELWRLHVEDALTALPLIEPGSVAELVDVGSGGGSPGVPLALALGCSAVLVESSRPKAAFLQRVLAETGLPGEVVHARSEEYGRGQGRDRFPLAVARALAPPPAAVELCLPLVRPGGRLILWTGAVDAAELAPAAVTLGGDVADVRPTAGERRLVVVEKREPTPEGFPRRPGMARKRPLRSLPSKP